MITGYKFWNFTIKFNSSTQLQLLKSMVTAASILFCYFEDKILSTALYWSLQSKTDKSCQKKSNIHFFQLEWSGNAVLWKFSWYFSDPKYFTATTRLLKVKTTYNLFLYGLCGWIVMAVITSQIKLELFWKLITTFFKNEKE